MDLIVAVSQNWGIGYEGKLLFSIPADLRYFRGKTRGAVVVMGRTTLESLPGGAPLAGRRNIVLSRTMAPRADVELAADLDTVFELVRCEQRDVYIIGGERVYRAFLPYCRRAYVTRVESCPVADRFFPNLDSAAEWALESAGARVQSGGYTLSFSVYINKNMEVAG